MMMKQTRTSDGARVSDATQEAVEAATQVLDSSREFARKAAGRIGETARDLRDGAADLARTSADSVGDALVAAQGQVGRYASAARHRVAREPLKSALIAAAVGAAAAALAMAVFRSRSHTD